MTTPATTPDPVEDFAKVVGDSANEIGRLWTWLIAISIAAGTATPSELRAMVKKATSTASWPEGGR